MFSCMPHPLIATKEWSGDFEYSKFFARSVIILYAMNIIDNHIKQCMYGLLRACAVSRTLAAKKMNSKSWIWLDITRFGHHAEQVVQKN